MLKIIIADDKSFEREKLRSIIDWEMYGMSIAGEAQNGKEALSLCKKLCPDVLITDIRMPVMDGIELADRLLAEQPGVAIVFLTGYDDFQYTQQAINLRVRSYILKPYTEQEIIDAMRRVTGQITQAALRKRREENLNRIFEGNLDMLRKSFLYEAITSQKPLEEKDFWNRSSTLGLQFQNDAFAVAMISTKPEAKHTLASLMRTFSLRQDCIVERICAGVLDKYLDGYHIIQDGAGLLVLLNPDDMPESRRDQLVAGLAAAFSENHFEPVIRFSSVGYGYKSWPRLYQEVSICPEAPAGAEPCQIDVFQKEYSLIEPEILSTLSERRADRAVSLLRPLFAQAKTAGLRAPHLSFCCLSLVMAVTELKSGGDMLRSWLEKLMVLSESDDVMVWMEALLAEAGDRLSQQKKGKNEQLVQTVLKIIETRYQTELDVAAISAEVFMSQNYLRSIFKEQTGQSLSSYLTDYRVEKACALLRNTSCRIADIPEMVGLASSPYFFFLFKKAVGCTPSEYRQREAVKMA